MSKRVLITGGAGFIGSNLHERCLLEGWSVYYVDDYSNGNKHFVVDGAQGLAGDFVCDQILDKIKRQEFDVVMHLAAIPRVGYSVEQPVITNDINVSKSLALMDACRNNVEQFIFASSSSVYGDIDVANGPTKETASRSPNSPYALQKAHIEDYLKLYQKLYRFNSVSLRFFNVFGPKQLGSSPYSCAISAWLTNIANNLPMRSDGDGTQTRDLCYVDNVVDCCVRAAKLAKHVDSPINVACGERTSNNSILQHLRTMYPNAESYSVPARIGDVKHTHADITLAKEVLGYTPLVKIWDGIEKTAKWYEENNSFIRNTAIKL